MSPAAFDQEYFAQEYKIDAASVDILTHFLPVRTADPCDRTAASDRQRAAPGHPAN
jgi:hypothetical protein